LKQPLRALQLWFLQLLSITLIRSRILVILIGIHLIALIIFLVVHLLIAILHWNVALHRHQITFAGLKVLTHFEHLVLLPL